MAGLALLDGSSALVDFTVPTTAVGTPVSLKCFASDIAVSFRRALNNKTTFCSASWMEPTAGVRQGFGHIGGFASVGTALSHPTVLISVDDPLPYIFTATTGNTIAQKLIITEDMQGVRALGDFVRGLDFVTFGAPTTTWVIT